jgi:hypothetical protein
VSLVSINVWTLAGDTLNITCNFLYYNHQVHKDFLITLHNVRYIMQSNTKHYLINNPTAVVVLDYIIYLTLHSHLYVKRITF